MKQLSSAQVRQMFLDFFQSKGHTIEPCVFDPRERSNLIMDQLWCCNIEKIF